MNFDFIEKYSLSAREWGLSLVIATSVFILASWAIRHFTPKFERLSQKTDTAIDDLLVAILKKVHPLFIFILSLYIATFFSPLHAHSLSIAKKLFMGAFWIQMLLFGISLVNLWIKRYETSKADSNDIGATTMVLFAGMAVKFTLTLICSVIVLDSFGFNVTGLMAGLGVGGIAVAIAVQNILGDLFASLSIILDKPFVVGDFIVTSDATGTVEHIGLKSTRIRSLDGEQIVCANGSLLKNTIKNYKRMQERRVVLSFGVIYETELENIELIPKIVKKIIDDMNDCRFDRAHFKSYGTSSLDFETVYFIIGADYNLYMDIQQKINLEIFREFVARKIEFAYPTQKLYFKMEGNEAEAFKPKNS